MTIELEERLHRLAARAHTSGDGVDDLWRRGRGLRRRRRLTSSALAGVIFLAGSVAGVGLWQAVDERPEVASPSATSLPDRVYLPGKWLPGTDDAGPLGPLSVVMGAERGQLLGQSTYAVVGISAATGQYRFLDLPDLDEAFHAEKMALSPDGRYLAYWIPDTRQRDHTDIAAGFNVYDTASGEVRRFLERGTWGLSAWEFSWTGTRLWVAYGIVDELTDDGYSSTITRGSVDAADPSATFEPTSAQKLPLPFATEDTWILNQGQLRHGKPDAAGPRERYTISDQLASPNLSPSAALIVGAEDFGNDIPFALLVGSLPQQPGPITLAPIPGDPKAYELLGWRDQKTVIYIGYAEGSEEAQLMAMDFATGEMTTIARLPSTGWKSTPVFAQAALSADVQKTPEPNWPMNPGITYGATILVVLAGLAAGLLGWRRRALG